MLVFGGLLVLVLTWYYFGISSRVASPDGLVVVDARVRACEMASPSAVEILHRREGLRTVVRVSPAEQADGRDLLLARACSALGIEYHECRLRDPGMSGAQQALDALRVLTRAGTQQALVVWGDDAPGACELLALYLHSTRDESLSTGYRRMLHVVEGRAGDAPTLILDYAGDIARAHESGHDIQGPSASGTR